MKKIATAVILGLALIGSASAQHRHYGHHGHRVHTGPNWGYVIAPLIIGGVVGAAIANRPVEAAPVIIHQPTPQGSFIQCPQGTYPFENVGWVKNQYGQFVQATYIECK